ncbi:MAG: DUF983 domain-containing protein [Flavobacteriales bacterium]|nr:DUF983 domain-containing protein [Flavobacteriales bacterium]
MSQSTGAFRSAITFKCPHCHQTSMYTNPSLYTLEKLGETKLSCEVCHTNLKPEPGFYFGAAYVAWGLTIIMWFSIFVMMKLMAVAGWFEFGFITHPALFISVGAIATLVLFPYMFRLSRSIWAHFFIK